MTDEQLRMLEDRRLIRREWVRGAERVELTHDLLTPVAREHRARQRLDDRMRREQLARRRFMLVATGLVVIAFTMAFLYLTRRTSRKSGRKRR